MVNKWGTGWVVLAGTARTPGAHQHRPHPDRPAATVCDRVINDVQVHRHRLARVPVCVRCEAKVAGSRRLEKAVARRAQEANARAKRTRRVVDVDAYDRANAASSSVRAARGGLPGLGRRR